MRPTVEWDARGNVDWKKEYLEVSAQLRRYMEAEPVWQARRVVYGHAFGWFGIHKSEVDDFTTRRNYEVRRLIVAPKTESDGA